MSDKDMELLKEMCKPLIQFLIDKHNPHTTIEITTNLIKVKEEINSLPIKL